MFTVADETNGHSVISLVFAFNLLLSCTLGSLPTSSANRSLSGERVDATRGKPAIFEFLDSLSEIFTKRRLQLSYTTHMKETQPIDRVEITEDPEKYASYADVGFEPRISYTNRWTKKLLSWGVEERGR